MNKSHDWTPTLSGDVRRIVRDITGALTADIKSGVLSPGDEMPSQRELAERLGINFTTVTRAYQEARERGLLIARPGQGTFVRANLPATALAYDHVADLSSNWPPPVKARALLGQVLNSVVKEQGTHAIEYRGDKTSPIWLEAGRRWLSPLFGSRLQDRIVMSAGSRGAFLAVMTEAVRPGGVLLTESMTWPTIKAVAQILGIQTIGVEMDADGIVPDALERACRQYRARALYCTPTAQNPTSVTMSEERRRQIGKIAKARGVTIIEDDAYGRLVPTSAAPLAAFAPESTIYVGGLAKTLVPGLRVAFVVCPDARRAAQMAERLRLAMLVPPPLEAMVASRIIMDGIGDEILAEIRAEMRLRHATLRTVLGTQHVSVTSGALHAFVSLPPRWSRAEFIAQLAGRGVRVASSDAFAVSNNDVPHAIRLALGAPESESELRSALDRIAELSFGEPSFTSRMT